MTATPPLPPGPRGRKSLGLLVGMRRDVLGAFRGLIEEYGDVIHFRLGTRPVIFVNDPEYVSQVFRARAGRYSRDTYMNSLAKRVLGENGLIANDGAVWARQRRMLKPVFGADQMGRYHGIMREEAVRMLDSWEAGVDGGVTQDAGEATGELSLRIAARALFGVELTPRLHDAVHGDFLWLNEDLTWRLTSLLPLPPVLPTLRDLRWHRRMRRLNAALEEVIVARRQGEATGDLVSLLLQARDEATGEGMADQEVRDHVKTFMLGGYETTAHALAWSILLLAEHPHVAERLEREVDTVLDGALPRMEDLERLPLARAVFEEAMRLYPPGWMTARRAEEEDTIGGYRVPSGADVLLCMYTVHRNSKLWDHAEEFRPERFLDTGERPPRFAYFPFGGGPQACIGRGFAMLQGQTVLAMVAQRFRAVVAPEHVTEVEPLLTLRSRHGVKVRLVRRRAQERALPSPTYSSAALGSALGGVS